MTDFTRRRFLFGLAAAPLVVPAVKHFVMPQPPVGRWGSTLTADPAADLWGYAAEPDRAFNEMLMTGQAFIRLTTEDFRRCLRGAA